MHQIFRTHARLLLMLSALHSACIAEQSLFLPGHDFREHIRLKLVTHINLDVRSPRVQSARPTAIPSLPQIVSQPDRVVFLTPSGDVRSTIALPTTSSPVAILSPNSTSVLLATQVQTAQSDDADKEGEDLSSYTVYDAAGRVVSRFLNAANIDVHLSDTGPFVLEHMPTGLLSFVNRTNGSIVTQFQFLGQYSSGEPHIAISPDGQHVAIAAASLQLRGTRYPTKDTSARDLATLGTPELWVGQFSGAGQQLWLRRLPTDGAIASVGISDDGSRTVVLTSPKDPATPSAGYLLDAGGSVLQTSSDWHRASLGISYQAEQNAFILGAKNAQTATLVGNAGQTTHIGITSSALAGGQLIASTGSAAYFACIAHLQKHVYLLLFNHRGVLVADAKIGKIFDPPRRHSCDRDDADATSVSSTQASDYSLTLHGDVLTVTTQADIRQYQISTKDERHDH